MSRTEATKKEMIGLDIGTSRIVTARQINNEINYSTQLNAFVTIPYSRMTESILQKEAVPHAVDGDEILFTATNRRDLPICSTKTSAGQWHGACSTRMNQKT